MSFMIYKMMFKGGTFLCKVKAILLPVKLKASPGRQGAKGIPRNLKKVKSITNLEDKRGFIAWVCIFSQEGQQDLFYGFNC